MRDHPEQDTFDGLVFSADLRTRRISEPKLASVQKRRISMFLGEEFDEERDDLKRLSARLKVPRLRGSRDLLVAVLDRLPVHVDGALQAHVGLHGQRRGSNETYYQGTRKVPNSLCASLNVSSENGVDVHSDSGGEACRTSSVFG